MIKIVHDEWFVDLGEISAFPPIGLMFLAGYIREHSNYCLRLIDSVVENMSYADIEDLFRKEMPDVLGITAFTHTFYDILKTVKIAKKINPKITVVLGGPHISMFWKDTFVHKEVDYMIEGDGEESFLELLKAIENKHDISGIPGLIYRENNKIKRNDPGSIKDLDSLPFPAFDLLDGSKYYSTIGTKKNVGAICSSRGCPFRCTYCQVTEKTYRVRTPKHIVDEIELYLKNGIDDFSFFDDMFNITPKRVIEICEEILKRNLDITWTFRGRVDQVNDEMYKIAKKAGCICIIFGIEDYTNENLRKIGKKITIEQCINAINLAKKYKIQTSTNWIIGFPHHKNRRDIHDLLKTAIMMNSDYAQFSILQLMPLSKMYDDCVREGDLDKNTWLDFVRNPTSDSYVELYEKYLSREELSELYKMCHQKFYFRSYYILKSLLKLRNFAELKIRIKTAYTIFLKRK